MKRKITVAIGVIILLMAVHPLFTVDLRAASALIVEEMIYVDAKNTEGPWEGTLEHPYQYIQSGIDHTAVNDTVYIFNGTYYENITINRSINLIGESKENTIVDGLYSDTVVHILSDRVLIQHLTVRNSGGCSNNAGIKSDANISIIKNCIIYRTKTGIFVNNTSSSEINNCTLFSNGDGILLKSSATTIIEGCSLDHNAIGIRLEDSSNNLITYCYIHTNGIACLFNNSSNIVTRHCNISDNSDNHGGVFFTKCSNSTVSNCIMRHNGMGINTANSNLISIKKCSFYLNTHFAVLIRQSSYDITVSQCEIIQNFRYGVYVIESSSCTLNENNFYENMLHGLYVEDGRCNAKNNWWGSLLGPSHTELGKGSRATWKLGSIRFIPWLLRSLDNIGADWKNNEKYMDDKTSVDIKKQIELPDNDTDSDSVPDWWEIKYEYDPESWDNHTHLDPDNDGLNNIEECFTDQWDSDPFHKDIFLEIDWTEPQNPVDPTNKPPDDLIEQLITIFAEHEITLHVDTGELGGGEELSYMSCFSFADLRDLYWNYFLHNDLNNPRKGIFHYGLICDYGPDLNFPFVGWDNLDSFLISAQWMHEKMPYFTRERLIVGGTAHQLGSSLGLLAEVHGGNDNLEAMKSFTIQWLKYRNYKSCMNYYYKYRIFSYSDGTHGWGDFDDWEHLDFSFFNDSHFEYQK